MCFLFYFLFPKHQFRALAVILFIPVLNFSTIPHLHILWFAQSHEHVNFANTNICFNLNLLFFTKKSIFYFIILFVFCLYFQFAIIYCNSNHGSRSRRQRGYPFYSIVIEIIKKLLALSYVNFVLLIHFLFFRFLPALLRWSQGKIRSRVLGVRIQEQWLDALWYFII